MTAPRSSNPTPDRGRYINEHATIGMRLTQLRAELPEVEKQARKTPRKDLLDEVAKVHNARARVPNIKREIASLETEHAGLRALLVRLGHFASADEDPHCVGKQCGECMPGATPERCPLVQQLERASSDAMTESKWPCFQCGSKQAHETGYGPGMSTWPACAVHAAEYTQEKALAFKQERESRTNEAPPGVTVPCPVIDGASAQCIECGAWSKCTANAMREQRTQEAPPETPAEQTGREIKSSLDSLVRSHDFWKREAEKETALRKAAEQRSDNPQNERGISAEPAHINVVVEVPEEVTRIAEEIERLARQISEPAPHTRPSYNHTRDDGPHAPCSQCLLLMSADDLRAYVKDLRGKALDYPQGALNRANADIILLREALRSVEWSGGAQAGIGDGTDPCCPSCGAWAHLRKHEPECALVAALGLAPRSDSAPPPKGEGQ